MSTVTDTGTLTGAQEQSVEDLEFEPSCDQKLIDDNDLNYIIDCTEPAKWFVVYVRTCEPRNVVTALMCARHHLWAVGPFNWSCGRCDGSHQLKVIRAERIS